MTTRMLIDARHQEETRVAVVKGGKIEEFDFESAEHKQLKGNIYLAKITRVEPSLQAAFVDYGGNRHGFLAFNEIHPDYYNIPKEDREALLAEEAEHAAEEAALRAQEEGDESAVIDEDGDSDDNDDAVAGIEEVETDDSVDTIDVTEGQIPENGDDTDDSDDVSDDEQSSDDEASEDGEEDDDSDDNESSEGDDAEDNRRKGRGRGRRRGRGGRNSGPKRAAKASDQARAKRLALRRRYKIQDVIQRRQVVLVQVVKEERGNKGAALTTYLSLAGRYCVLMPNTSHGGGISRKISSASDRKRLKSIVEEMKLPVTMGCIVRTAGASRTKVEIKRDFDYLARLWDEIREKTLKATAPSLIHSDSELIKRAIRDIYNRDIEEVLVEGPDGYRDAKDFMKLLMPSHSRRVKSYADPVSLFQRFGVEDQLSAMYLPEVQLKSGGYLVINPTEALVSIDINSGRSTREHGIEATALNTNLEAAQEIARQLRLRDMAGLVVIDFIDMDRHGNARKVEKAMRDALKNDRARIQVGRISSFGLMEMSRQRLRTGVLEASTRTCPHCEGTGLVRTASSAALSALRMIEEEAATGKSSKILLKCSQEAAIYLLNTKRPEIAEIEARYGVTVEVAPDGSQEGARMEVQTSGPPPANAPTFEPIVDVDDDNEAEQYSETGDDEDDKPKRKRRRRGRRGRGRKNEEAGDDSNADAQSADAVSDGETQFGGSDAKSEPSTNDATDGEQEEKPRRRRRSRRKKTDDAPQADDQAEEAEQSAEDADKAPAPAPADKPAAEVEATDGDAADDKADEAPAAKAPAKPRARRKAKASEEAAPAEAAVATAEPAAQASDTQTKASDDSEVDDGADEGGEPRKGWWQRTFG